MLCCVGKSSTMNQTNHANVPLTAGLQNSISLKKTGRPRKPPFDTSTIFNINKVSESIHNRNHSIAKSRVINHSNGDVSLRTENLHQSPLSDITSSNIFTFSICFMIHYFAYIHSVLMSHFLCKVHCLA